MSSNSKKPRDPRVGTRGDVQINECADWVIAVGCSHHIIERSHWTRDDHLVFSIFVTVICPLMRSASNLTLSPTFTCLSIAGSCTRKTIVIPSFISSFLIGP